MTTIDKAKYKNTILFLCDKLGGKIEGKKKLYKLLYYVDFDRYQYNESMKSVTGEVYKKLPMGPVPDHGKDLLVEMSNDGILDISTEEQYPGFLPTTVYSSSVKPDMDVFDKDDIAILHMVAAKYGHLNGKQLEDLTHNEAPYIASDDMCEIPYELTFYRNTDFDICLV